MGAMPDYGIKQQHGGDDDPDVQDEEVVEKIKLDKYLHASDFNLTDMFERIIRAYQRKEKTDNLLERIKHERMSLLRSGIRAVNNGLPHLKISKNRIAYYLVKMILDQDWRIVFKNLVTETYNLKTKHPLPLIVGINKAYYEQKKKFEEWTTELIINIDNEEIISLINEMHNDELTRALKKQLMLIARDDVGNNKNNAIHSLIDILNEDADIAKLFRILLRRNDPETQIYVLHAISLKKKIENKDLIEQIKELDKKTGNSHIKTLIKRILS